MTGVRTLLFATVGAVMAVGVGIHEWIYHQNHKYAPGVSGLLVVLSIAVALGCLAVADLAWGRQRDEIRRREDDLRRAQGRVE